MEGKDKPRFTRFNKWLILVVTTLVMMVDFALLFSLGALYIDIMETYETDRATAAVVQSLMTGVTLGFGVFSGALISTLGLHGVTLTASVLVPLGFISSFFATSIHVLYITIGITSAIGTSLSHVSCVTVVGRVFKGRHQIMSITILNTAVGFASLGYPYLLSWLSDIFGLQGTFLILGGITSNTFILCIVCFINRKALSDGPLDHSKGSENDFNAETTRTNPIRTITDEKEHLIDTPDGDEYDTSLNLKHIGVSETRFIAETYDNIKYNSKNNDDERTEVDIIDDREDELALEDNNGEKVFKEDPTICIKHIEFENNDQKEIPEKNIVADKKEGTVKNKSTPVANETQAAKLETTKYTKVTKLKRHFETVHCLLKEIMTKPYVCLVLAFAFGNISLNGYLGVKLDIAMWKGLSESEGLSSFLAFNCSNIVSRFIPGLLKERKGINSFVYPVISAVSGFCGQLLIYFSGQISVYMIGVCLCGIAFGGIVSSSINATVRIVSLEQVPIAVGFLISVNGILIVGVGPLFGAVRDISGSYGSVIMTICSAQAAAAIFYLAAMFLRKQRSKEVANQTHTVD
ncbi:uncharacterized protein LOC132725711 isoform X2 [Ruditapes philippinarum]|uniref:uncharacterized protein LOC132725711 isoform X2 n=1 Tax=Ruditapes philippinarum TaxID=129788 RepID=UPI00295BD43A|nr:uncharacterized protein LOC132725711 isoform X2 [Ruditapes philippinarum]